MFEYRAIREVIKIKRAHKYGDLIRYDLSPWEEETAGMVNMGGHGRKHPSASQGDQSWEKSKVLTPWSWTSASTTVRKIISW
jgi:hypothetical protein